MWEASEWSRTIAVSAPNFRDWHEGATSFSALGAWTGGQSTVLGGREPVVAGVYLVTRQYFAALGVTPVVGRTFTDDEAQLNGTPAVVVSHGLWSRVLGGDDDLSRLSLEVDGRKAAGGGVMPPGFAYPPDAAVWAPYESQADTSGRTSQGLVAGLLAAAGLTRFLQSRLFGVASIDAVTFGAAAAVLTAVCARGRMGPGAASRGHRSRRGDAGVGRSFRAPPFKAVLKNRPTY